MMELGVYIVSGLLFACARLAQSGDMADRHALWAICLGLFLIIVAWPVFVLLWLSDMFLSKR